MELPLQRMFSFVAFEEKFIYYKLRFGYLAVLQHHRAAPLQFLFGFGQTTVGSGMSNTEGLEHEKNI